MEDKSAYSVSEVAALTAFSRQTITRLFENERGVLILRRPRDDAQAPHRSIRIPQAVLRTRLAKAASNERAKMRCKF